MDQDQDLQADWSAAELSVLRAAELDLPAPGAAERTLAALGVGSALSAGAGGAASLGAGAHLARAARGSLRFKWSSAALIAGGVAAVFFFARQRHEITSPHATQSANSNVTPMPSTAPAVSPESQPGSASDATAVAAAISPAASAMATPSAAPSANARGAVAPEKDVLAQEIRLIDEARARLRKADPQGSLETLSRYDQLVKHGGSMRAEATVVRIEAYQKSGDTARAAALGQRFLDKNPDSPYVDYVKRMLARAN